MLDSLTTGKNQAQASVPLDSLLRQKTLAGNMAAFILSCKVNEYSPRTIQAYKERVQPFIDFCASMNISTPDQCTANIIRLYLVKRQETNGPVSIHDIYRSLHAYFAWIVNEGGLSVSPMATMRAPKLPRKIVQPLSPKQIQDIFTVTSGTHFIDYRNRALIAMFLDTGIRLKEMAGIQLADIDLDRELIKINGKGARERVVRICRDVQKYLLRYLYMRNDSYPCLWLTEERTPLTADGIKVMVMRIIRQAGITEGKRGPHILRHTAAILSLDNGADLSEIQAMLGHSTLDMAKKYLSSVNSVKAAMKHKKFSPVENLLKRK